MYGFGVVVTGVGTVTPSGSGVQVLHQALLKGLSGIKYRENLGYLAGAIDDNSADFERWNAGQRREMSRASQLAVLAAEEALTAANATSLDHTETLVNIGTGVADLNAIAETSPLSVTMKNWKMRKLLQLQKKLRIRVIQAMREICVLKRWTSSVFSCIILQQLCYTGRWYDDHPLPSHPILNEDECNHLGNGMTIPLLQEKLAVSKSDSYTDVLRKAQKDLSSLSFSKEHIEKIIKCLCDYPILSIKRCELFCNNEYFSIALNPETSTKLRASSDCRSVLQLNTIGCGRNNTIATLPRWSKEKITGWIILVSETSTNRLLSLSYSGPIKEQKIVRIRVSTPEKKGKYSWTITILSDCYLGIDEEYTFNMDVI